MKLKKSILILVVLPILFFSCNKDTKLQNNNTGFTRFLTAIEKQDLITVQSIISVYPNIFKDNQNLNITVLEMLLNTGNYNYIKTISQIFPENFWTTKNVNGDIPLSFLLKNPSYPYDLIRLAVDKTEDLGFRDNNGETFLTLASSNNEDIDVLYLLFDKGLSIGEKNENGLSPLICAAKNNKNPFIYKELRNIGFDLSSEEKVNIILEAIKNPNQYVFKNIVFWEKPAEMNFTDSDGKSLLMYACEYSNFEAVKILSYNLKEINKTDKQGKTALMYACQNNSDLQIIKLLKKNGAENQLKDKDGISALKYAIGNKNLTKYKVICLILIFILALVVIAIILLIYCFIHDLITPKYKCSHKGCFKKTNDKKGNYICKAPYYKGKQCDWTNNHWIFFK